MAGRLEPGQELLGGNGAAGAAMEGPKCLKGLREADKEFSTYG